MKQKLNIWVLSLGILLLLNMGGLMAQSSGTGGSSSGGAAQNIADRIYQLGDDFRIILYAVGGVCFIVGIGLAMSGKGYTMVVTSAVCLIVLFLVYDFTRMFT